MILFPAIDLKNGMCVRLKRGDFDTVERVADDPAETARRLRAAGARHLHVVDLDGAKDGIRSNKPAIDAIIAAFGGFVELGGGLRDMASLRDAAEQGVSRVILGSAAFRDREFLREAVRTFGDRVAVGIDAKSGRVSLAGWLEDTGADYIDFARECEVIGVKNIIYTDIGRDGLLAGPDFDGLRRLSEAVRSDVTASGGVSTIEDIKKLQDMGLYGAICGKAIYTGGVPLAEAVALTGDGEGDANAR